MSRIVSWLRGWVDAADARSRPQRAQQSASLDRIERSLAADRGCFKRITDSIVEARERGAISAVEADRQIAVAAAEIINMGLRAMMLLGIALTIAACGTAPQYQLRAYISDGGACLESEAACGAPNTTCAVSVDFQLDCTGYDNSVTESVALDVERREIAIVATGCQDLSGLCGTVRAWVRFADDGSVSGIGEIVEYGVPFVVHGGLM